MFNQNREFIEILLVSGYLSTMNKEVIVGVIG